MSYQLEPEPITRRRGRPIMVVTAAVVIGVAILLAGLTFSAGPQENPIAAAGTAAPIPAAAASSVTAIEQPDATTAARVDPVEPPDIECRGVGPRRCRAAAEAALAATVEPGGSPIVHIDVWASMLCDSAFDCPADRLRDREPAGSAVVRFASGMEAWVNLTGAIDPGHPSQLTAYAAWVIRSAGI